MKKRTGEAGAEPSRGVNILSASDWLKIEKQVKRAEAHPDPRQTSLLDAIKEKDTGAK